MAKKTVTVEQIGSPLRRPGEQRATLIGLGLNAFILVIASLMLVIDFERVEQIVDAGAPRSMEWYAAFGLLVTLAWIYYEAVKMVFRLAVILGNRK